MNTLMQNFGYYVASTTMKNEYMTMLSSLVEKSLITAEEKGNLEQSVNTNTKWHQDNDEYVEKFFADEVNTTPASATSIILSFYAVFVAFFITLLW